MRLLVLLSLGVAHADCGEGLVLLLGDASVEWAEVLDEDFDVEPVSVREAEALIARYEDKRICHRLGILATGGAAGDALRLAHGSSAGPFVVLVEPSGEAPRLPPVEQRRAYANVLVLRTTEDSDDLIERAYGHFAITTTDHPRRRPELWARLAAGWLADKWGYSPSHSWWNDVVFPELRDERMELTRSGPDRPSGVLQFNLSGLFAAGRDFDEGAFAGELLFRPEVFFGQRSERHLGWGVYGEIGEGQGFTAGGGGSLFWPFGDELALIPSIGAYTADEAGGVAGLYFGHASYNTISHFQGLAGVRAQVRIEKSGAMLATFGLQIDATSLAAIIGFM